MVSARLSKANAEAVAIAMAQQKENEAKAETQSVANVRKPSVLNNKSGSRPQQVQQTASQGSGGVGPPSVTSSFVSKRLDNIPTQFNEQGEEEELYSCILPDDVLVELLADRMQVLSYGQTSKPLSTRVSLVLKH